ncbi:ribonuclease P protein component [Aminobacterium colombiense]|uniref:ribonuclease P protein component n=1 Tax=Aminobacterium colombiense TaxID=81468 RepID=UPI003322BA28
MRLKKGWEYDHVFRTGSRFKGELVRLLFVEAPDDRTRIGLAVGKRQGSACVRNRGRRILKESIRRILPWVKGTWWCVFSLRTAGLEANAYDVYDDMVALLGRVGLLDESWPGNMWEKKNKNDG